jgi:hypothetical protein
MPTPVPEPDRDRAPAPWRVGDRPSPQSMFPIRAADDRVIGYAYRRAIAELIVDQANLQAASPTLAVPRSPG